jgi:hypothetical protein
VIDRRSLKRTELSKRFKNLPTPDYETRALHLIAVKR